jgi:hypothetical protein
MNSANPNQSAVERIDAAIAASQVEAAAHEPGDDLTVSPQPEPAFEHDFSEFAEEPSDDSVLAEPPRQGRLDEPDLNDPAYLDDLAKRKPALARYLVLTKQSAKIAAQSRGSAEGITLQPYSEIEARSIEWLWKNRIPCGALTIFAGDPGVGKSLGTVDLTARVSDFAQLRLAFALWRRYTNHRIVPVSRPYVQNRRIRVQRAAQTIITRTDGSYSGHETPPI